MALATLAVIAAVTAGMLMWKRPTWRRIQAWLMLIVGLALGGQAGVIRDRLMALAESTSATTTQKVLGVGVAYAVALILVIWFALDMDFDGLVAKMRRKGAKGGNKHTTTAMTPWLALLVPGALAALPVVGGLSVAAQSGASFLATNLLGI